MKPESKVKVIPGKHPTSGEKPTTSETQEWILSVSNTTGQVTKIERLGVGRREEISEAEYAAVMAAYPGALSISGPGSAADATAELYTSSYDVYGYQQVYYQGMYDCAAYIAKTLDKGTHEEQAYVKGLLDSLSSNA